MKRKILFVIPEYSIGGTNTSLKNLLSFIDMDKYDVFVYCLYENGGQHFKEVFKPYILPKSRLYYWLHDNVFTRKFMGLGMRLSSKVNFDWLYEREAKWLQWTYNFDVVIGYQEGPSTFILPYFETAKKIAWFHSPCFDFVPDIRKLYYDCYECVDAIVCVSNTFVNSFISIFPEFVQKVFCIYNTLNNKIIRQMAKDPINDSRFGKDDFTIVSIGRFSEQKQFHLIPKIVNEINRIGVEKKIKWYLITSWGTCREQTEDEIKKYGLQDQVIILGEKTNPYPVLNASNLYVCTSKTESFCYTIAESQILHTPLVSNDFPVAYEVVDDSAGWICNIKDMAKMIADIINDKGGLYSHKCESIANYDYCNESIIRDFDKLIDFVLC